MKVVPVLLCCSWLWLGCAAAQGETSPSVLARGEWSEPVNLEIVNSPTGEKGPCISPDGKRLYVSRGGHPENIGGSNWNIWYTDWDGEKWGPLKNLGPEINEGGAYDPSFTPDGKLMYFHSDRAGGSGGFDLYCSEWDGTKWSTPKNLGSEVNTAAHEWTPSISPDGNTLYFLGRGLMVTKRVAGAWQKATSLESEGEGFSQGTCPWRTYDGKEFYFARMIFEQTDSGRKLKEWFMWVCDVVDGKLGTPVKVPGKVNLADSDACCPTVSADGKTMFFSSERAGGKGRFDIWMSKRELAGDPPAAQSPQTPAKNLPPEKALPSKGRPPADEQRRASLLAGPPWSERTSYETKREEMTLPATAAGVEASLIIFSPAKPGKYPCLIYHGAPSISSLLDCDDIAKLGFVAVSLSPRGGPGGLPTAEAMKGAIEYVATLDSVNRESIGMLSESARICDVACTLGRYPELPVSYWVDLEGPSNRHMMCAWDQHGHDSADDDFWREREPYRWVRTIKCRYQRVQSEYDHTPYGKFYYHAQQMINNANKAGAWTRLNDNPPNINIELVAMGTIELQVDKYQWLPGHWKESVESHRKIVGYIVELSQMPPLSSPMVK